MFKRVRGAPQFHLQISMISVDVGHVRGRGRGGIEQCLIHKVLHSRGESAETSRRKQGTNGVFWKTDTFHIHTFNREPLLFQIIQCVRRRRIRYSNGVCRKRVRCLSIVSPFKFRVLSGRRVRKIHARMSVRTYDYSAVTHWLCDAMMGLRKFTA